MSGVRVRVCKGWNLFGLQFQVGAGGESKRHLATAGYKVVEQLGRSRRKQGLISSLYHVSSCLDKQI
jgi:hypothetical protein